jgi:uncharacterized membrane protein
MSTSPSDTPVVDAGLVPPQSLITITTAVYVLLAIGILPPFFPAFIAAVIINYVKRDDVRGTFLESHFRWQIRTFWFGLLWLGVGLLTWLILIGYLITAAGFIWIMYRIIKGWLDLVDRKPMYRAPAA